MYIEAQKKNYHTHTHYYIFSRLYRFTIAKNPLIGFKIAVTLRGFLEITSRL